MGCRPSDVRPLSSSLWIDVVATPTVTNLILYCEVSTRQSFVLRHIYRTHCQLVGVVVTVRSMVWTHSMCQSAMTISSFMPGLINRLGDRVIRASAEGIGSSELGPIFVAIEPLVFLRCPTGLALPKTDAFSNPCPIKFAVQPGTSLKPVVEIVAPVQLSSPNGSVNTKEFAKAYR